MISFVFVSLISIISPTMISWIRPDDLFHCCVRCLLLNKYPIPYLSIPLLMDFWVNSSFFFLLHVRMLWAFYFLGFFFLVPKCMYFFEVYIQLLNSLVTRYAFVENKAKQFSEVMVPIYTLLIENENSVALHTCQHLILCLFCVWIVTLICISLMTNNIEHYFMFISHLQILF